MKYRVYIGKYYRFKYKLIEIIIHFLIISFSDALKVFFFRREDKTLNDDKKYSQKIPYIKSDNKKTVVIFDDSVPRYDLSAGAKTLISYIKVYKNMGYDVKFLPDDFIAREPYVSYLEKELKVEVLCGKWWQKNCIRWFYDNKNNIAFVLFSAPRSINYIEYFKKYINTKILYYDMDMYFVREMSVFNVTKEKKHYRASKYYEKLEKKLFDTADAILTISDKENKAIRKITNKDNVYTLPCYIYDKFNNNEYDLSKREDILFVGGQKELANIDAIKWLCKDIMPKILKKNSDIVLNIVGIHNGMFIRKYQNKNINFYGKVSETRLAEIYNSARIAVAPLRFGAGVKAKVVEAMYYGVPVVATDFGTEGLIEIDNIIPVKNNTEVFAEEILRIYDDEKYLKNNSAKLYEYSQKYFSYECAKNIFDKIING